MVELWLSTAEARDCEAIARASWGEWIRTTDYLIQSQEPYRLATPQWRPSARS